DARKESQVAEAFRAVGSHLLVSCPERIDPGTAVVIGHGHTVDFGRHESEQPLLWRQIEVLPMPWRIQRHGRVRVKVELPPAGARIEPNIRLFGNRCDHAYPLFLPMVPAR